MFNLESRTLEDGKRKVTMSAVLEEPHGEEFLDELLSFVYFQKSKLLEKKEKDTGRTFVDLPKELYPQ